MLSLRHKFFSQMEFCLGHRPLRRGRPPLTPPFQDRGNLKVSPVHAIILTKYCF